MSNFNLANKHDSNNDPQNSNFEIASSTMEASKYNTIPIFVTTLIIVENVNLIRGHSIDNLCGRCLYARKICRVIDFLGYRMATFQRTVTYCLIRFCPKSFHMDSLSYN